MTQKSDGLNGFAFGSSLVGPGHKKLGIKNQDHFLIADIGDLKVLAVADGVGSCRFASYSSKRILRCLANEMKRARCRIPDLPKFMASVVARYQRTFRFLKKGMGTTLVAAMISRNGDAYFAQAGDGLCAWACGGTEGCLKNKDDAFGNLVSPISGTAPFDKWVLQEKHFENDLELLLCTDGVSEDILPDKRTAFLKAMAERCRKDGVRAIEKVLNDWPTPHSLDDK